MSNVFKLGRVHFRFTPPDESAESFMMRFNLQADESMSQKIIDVSPLGSVKDVINRILKLHHNCIWLDAACAVNPSGKKVLLTGKSQAGKSTLSLALSLTPGWTLLTEDILLVDEFSGEIIYFNSPFSIREDTVRRVQDALGPLSLMVVDDWIARIPIGENVSYRSPFDYCVALELDPSKQEIHISSLSAESYLSGVLRNSNLLSRAGLTELFFQMISDSELFKISGGSLPERLKFLQELS